MVRKLSLVKLKSENKKNIFYGKIFLVVGVDYHNNIVELVDENIGLFRSELDAFRMIEIDDMHVQLFDRLVEKFKSDDKEILTHYTTREFEPAFCPKTGIITGIVLYAESGPVNKPEFITVSEFFEKHQPQGSKRLSGSH